MTTVTKKATTSNKRPISKKHTTASKASPRLWLARKWQDIRRRQKNYLKRRPHRSFRRTRRRDYKRSLKLPGYIALTAQILRLLAKHKWLFLRLSLVYAALMLVLASIMSQDTYTQLQDTINEAGQGGFVSNIVPTLALFWGVLVSQVASTGSGSAGSSQQILGILIGLFTWLSAVWLLRNILAGRRPRVRDGLYSSGGPVIALLILACTLLIQFIPAMASFVIYSAADSSGLLDQTVMLMLFGGAAVLLSVLSLYWATATFFAMVIVTLPGMYPMQALKLAGDIVTGRRMRILLRLLWALLLVLVVWVVILIPTILLDGALKSALPGLGWLPLVPLVALGLMTFSIIMTSSYVYIFYRKVVEDDSAPA